PLGACRRRGCHSAKVTSKPAQSTRRRTVGCTAQGETDNKKPRVRAVLSCAPRYFFDHIFIDRSRQNLPHEFRNAQISQHCDKRKLAESMRREREISRHLFASIPHYYGNLRRTRGKDF